MSSPTFRLADPVADRSALLALNIEYVTWVFAEIEKISGLTARSILGSEVADYVPTVIDKVCGDPPPHGAFYLVESGGELLAMGGLRRSGDVQPPDPWPSILSPIPVAPSDFRLNAEQRFFPRAVTYIARPAPRRNVLLNGEKSRA